jgi:recombinational DNA repair protein (RecF pathway)
MRHKYPTRAIVLARAGVAEESALLTLLTRDVGLVRARAQGLRKSGAKLAGVLPTLSESDIVLVAGKEGWRVAGALSAENWFTRLPRSAREAAGRVAALLMRLVGGESPDAALYDIYAAFLAALASVPEAAYGAAECLAALRILAALGLDAGALPEGSETFSLEALRGVERQRAAFVARVNRGIKASGL